MKEIVSNVYVPRGLFVANCFFVKNSDGIDIIDSGVLMERFLINAYIKRFNLGLKRVLLTHSHADHAGNCNYFAKKYNASIFCDRRELPYLFHVRVMKRNYLGSPLFTRLIQAGDILIGHPKIKNLKIYEEDMHSGYLYDFIPVIGHTPGSIVIKHRPSKSLFFGDALLNCHIITFPAQNGLQLPFKCFADNYELALKSLKIIYELDFDNAFFGHGPPIIGDAKKKIVEFLKKNGI